MKRKELFLKWCVVTFAVSVLIGLAAWFGWSQVNGLHPIGKAIMLAVLFVFAKALLDAGFICWKVDDALEHHDKLTESGESKKLLRRLRHKAEHIAFSAHICPSDRKSVV